LRLCPNEVVLRTACCVDHVYTILGSSQASSRSAIRFDTSSISDIRSRKVPATYISWLWRERRNSGPVVGTDITTPIRIEEEMILGTSIATTLTTGFNAERTAYLLITLRSVRPFARAVVMYCWFI